ncbi:MAG TPA: hypothetical protein VFI55_08120 [Mycobacterium sp.]|nr:hypothetical protein [Mycobacterium sp.]
MQQNNEDPRRGTTPAEGLQNQPDTSIVDDRVSNPPASKWHGDFRRRVQRAAIDEHYFDMCPGYVQQAALQLLGRREGDAA